jgi:hypothetical protein
MVRWMTASAVSPQPLLALGAALCAVGAAAGRRWKLDRPDTRSNIYIIALADSGGGKDHPRRCVRRLFTEAGMPIYLGGETLASGSAVMTSVAQHPVRLFQVDEFGHFIAAVLDPKTHAHHRREIMTNLTTLWSSASEVVLGTEYANAKDRPRIDIQQPCVCLYGSTVPQTFWKSLQSGHVGDGSLARFLVFQTACNYPNEQDPEPVDRQLPSIVAAIKQIAAGDGSLSAVMAANVEPKPKVVPLDKSAIAADADLRIEHLSLKREYEGTPYSALVARYREHIRRIALVAAIASDPASPVCTAAHIEWATTLVRHCLETVLEQAQRFIADSEYEALSKRVLDVVRQIGGWVDGNTIARRCQFVARRQRADLIADLVESGALEAKQELTATRPRMLVKARRKGVE